MDALEELAALCEAEVHVSINPQKSTYESITKYLEFLEEEIDPEVLSEMIKRDRMVWVQAYPHTPIGFYCVYHYDINEAMQQVLEAVKANA